MDFDDKPVIGRNGSEVPAEVFEGNSKDPLVGTYFDYFHRYASETILERAIPQCLDGLKPVQRRILHAMHRKDDGRLTKVATLVGATMEFHPHGDASISSALVLMALKGLLIERQGNYGSLVTGDTAAAARYIEARLSAFSKEVVFNSKTTHWTKSYDGRADEPVTLPAKFPLLLSQGTEGIAVGLATSILPHNFNELLDASIAYLKGEDFELYPDFPTGGIADVSNYKDGQRGGRVLLRARIIQESKRVLRVTELPFGVTTESLKASIEQAAEKGKIRIASMQDFTAKTPDISIKLAPDADVENTLYALYAFTNCQVSLAPSACVILDNTPTFLGVSDILRKCADHTMGLLKWELEIRLNELEDAWHRCSLERIYIEKEVYMRMKKESEYEAIIETVDTGLKPHIAGLRRAVTREDIVRLTEIPIIRISRYSIDKAEELLAKIDAEIAEIQHKLEHIVEVAIDWFDHLKEKYGQGQERRTELSDIERVRAQKVIVANETLYVNEADGFAGYGTVMKREGVEVAKCSTLDDIGTVTADGIFKVYRVGEKIFIGRDLLFYGIVTKGDEERVFSLVYAGNDGIAYAKKFRTETYILEREYPLMPDGAKVIYFKAHEQEDPEEKVTLNLDPDCRARNKRVTFDMGTLMIKGRSSKGNRVSVHPISPLYPLAD